MSPFSTDYLYYLRRRVDDFPDPEQPVPKWTQLDYDAIRMMLYEIDRFREMYSYDTLETRSVTQTISASSGRSARAPRRSPIGSTLIGSYLVAVAIGTILGIILGDVLPLL